MRNSGAAIFFFAFSHFRILAFPRSGFSRGGSAPVHTSGAGLEPRTLAAQLRNRRKRLRARSAEPPSGISAAPPGSLYVSNFSAPPEHAPAPATTHLLRAPRHYSPSDPISRYSGALAKPTTAIASATLGDADSAVFGPHSPTTTPSMRERSLRECIF